MEILTREGILGSLLDFTSLGSISVCLFVFPASLLRMNTNFLFAPCFDHFQSDSGNGSAISNQLTMGTK